MRVLQLTILILLSNIAFGQVNFFKDYDFKKGGYYLLGTRSESDSNDLADSLGEWYTDDISVLNEFKTEWTFNEPGKKYSCGYHYVVYVCKEGLVQEILAINLNCNEIVGNKGYFYFETSKLSKFKNNLKNLLLVSVFFLIYSGGHKIQCISQGYFTMVFYPKGL